MENRIPLFRRAVEHLADEIQAERPVTRARAQKRRRPRTALLSYYAAKKISAKKVRRAIEDHRRQEGHERF